MANANSAEKKIRVAICGGGIAGLSLAVFLSRPNSLSPNPTNNLDVQLYESAPQFKEIGAGVVLWARTWRIMQEMGLAEQFAPIAHARPSPEVGVGFDYRRSDQPEEGWRFMLVDMPYGGIRFHRAEFLDVLVDNLPPGIAHFGKRLVSYTRSGPPEPNTADRAAAANSPLTLTFADGSTATCDVVIGADGIKSSIRAQMYTEAAAEIAEPGLLKHIQPVWTGVTSYRALINVKDIPRAKDGGLHRAVKDPIMYCGKSKHVVGYIISRGDLVNVIASKWEPHQEATPYNGEWVEACTPQEVLDTFAGWEPEVGQLLRCITDVTRWAIHHLVPLPFYQKDGVALIGDSAHAMAPNQAAGAGQAIGDAYILAHLLRKATWETLSSSLAAYEAVRLPIANDVMIESYHSGRMYEFDSEYGDDYPRLGPAIKRQWDWIDNISLEEEVQAALALVDKGNGCGRKSHDIGGNSRTLFSRL